MSTLPSPLQRLEVNSSELIENTRRMRNYTQKRMEFIVSRANGKINVSEENIEDAVNYLRRDIAFLKMVGMDYNNPDSKLIKVALEDYLLTH